MALLLLFIASLSFAAPTSTGVFEIEVVGIKGTEGQLGVVLFNSQNGFPEDHLAALDHKLVKIESGRTKVQMGPVPYGEYAIAVMHDENSNGSLDKNMMSIPKEGYGVSNNASAGMFGPPKYKDAMITLDSDRKTVEIKLRY